MSKESVIKAIDKTSVHRICSGQVVLNLATAVKELVENSIDASATVIEVKLKDYGSESVEVTDNGHGVHPDNFKGLTLKHHTSKLRDFSDLVGVETFGFRGEALSSLCALSSLSVLTRHTSQDCGTHLVFDSYGDIIQETQCARQIGTTVILEKLFHSLPVRQKEFHKNLKREYNKMVQFLYSYCLIATNTRITCINQMAKGARSTVVSTQGCQTVKENISCIFGAKQLNNVLVFSMHPPAQEVLEELKLEKSDCDIFDLDGLISSCAHGSGRATGDRQFYYINSRPCESLKIMKAVNEVYRQYNPNQYPFVFLNIKVAKDSVDVNVTPDKKQIFLAHEKLLLAIIKSSLNKIFCTIPSTYAMNNVPEKNVDVSRISEESKLNLSIFSQWRKDLKRGADNEPNLTMTKVPRIEKAQSKLNSFLFKPGQNSADHNCKNETNSSNLEVMGSIGNLKPERCNDKTDFKPRFKIFEKTHPEKLSESLTQIPVKVEEIFEKQTDPSDEACFVEIPENLTQNPAECHFEEIPENLDTPAKNNVVVPEEKIEYDSYIERGKKCIGMNIDIEMLKAKKSKSKVKTLPLIRFRAVIDPTRNDQAENELKREISKEMFSMMYIIGQFNLGFIITKLGSDLFIIDQHASDEKFNFETLQKTTVITNQKLVMPELLDLTAANEAILFDNLDIFKKNGFEFKIDKSAPPTKRVSLSAKPMSKNWLFGREDIDELIFMLQDSPNSDCRPSRVRAMFASRACRKSVMVGKALSLKEMRRLVTQMGTIEHPWNCPHGRPTMRHLVNLDLLQDS
ncbi:mismatch repair endonuclease PMS2 [Cimex lectularius]|uniref:Mismatch repair endonuclease PMS2 n=1 Tax=Cimex lectularius TaxID=79782 RepID=A0A8I6RLD3_CIMLE|nr:mismatch repair endonuclease PMS2 [Cimex lectularius]